MSQANNYVDNGTVAATGNALPSAKSNVSGAPALPAANSLSANDINTIQGALPDLKAVLNRTVSIMSYGADNSGATDCSAAFAQAIAALPAGGVIHLPSAGPSSATYRLSTNLTIPAGTALAFDAAAISIDNGVTLTIAGSIDAPQLQIFITAASPSTTPVKFTGGQAQVNVLWWGADPTNTSDSTQAIRNACNSQALDYEVTPDDQFVFSPPELWFPQGSYKIATAGGIPTSGTLRGTNAILYASTAGSGSTIDFFTGVGFQNRIRGFTFVHGRNGISASNAHASGSVVVDDCIFVGLAGACFLIDTTCDNVVFYLHDCLVANYTQTTGTVISASSGVVYAKTFSGGVAGSTIFYVGGGYGVSLFADGMNFAPETAGGQWIDVEASAAVSVSFVNSRFGGEASGKTIVKWNPTLAPAQIYPPNNVIDSSLLIENCDIYSDSGAQTFKFYALPMRMRFSGNRGVFGTGIYFDSSIPVDLRQQAQGVFFTKEFDFDARNLLDPASDPELTDRYTSKIEVSRAAPYLPADQILAFAASANVYGVTQSATAVTVTTPTDAFGLTDIEWAATSSTNNANRVFGTALASGNGVTVGPYTLLINVEQCSVPTTLQVAVAGTTSKQIVPAGRSTLAIPFYKAFADPAAWATSTAYSTLGTKVLSSDGINIFQCVTTGTSASSGNGPVGGAVQGYVFTEGTGVQWEWIGSLAVGLYVYNLTNGKSITLGRIRVIANHPSVANRNALCYDSAAPTTGSWFVGDTVYNTVPAAGTNIGWVCTAAGSPGTWKAFGQISL